MSLGVTTKEAHSFLFFYLFFPYIYRREKNKDIAIELIHYVNDGLWRYVFGWKFSSYKELSFDLVPHPFPSLTPSHTTSHRTEPIN